MSSRHKKISRCATFKYAQHQETMTRRLDSEVDSHKITIHVPESETRQVTPTQRIRSDHRDTRRTTDNGNEPSRIVRCTRSSSALTEWGNRSDSTPDWAALRQGRPVSPMTARVLRKDCCSGWRGFCEVSQSCAWAPHDDLTRVSTGPAMVPVNSVGCS